MNVVVLSPEKELFSGEASRVKVPGKAGQFEILKNHAPLVSSLDEGKVYVFSTEGEQTFEIKQGFIEVLKNEVAILVQE